LRVISTRNSVGLRLSELVTATGLERPTVRRLLQGLMREGFVRQADTTRRYFLGRALFELAASVSPCGRLKEMSDRTCVSPHPALTTPSDYIADIGDFAGAARVVAGNAANMVGEFR
jgi:hypothetical protein